MGSPHLVSCIFVTLRISHFVSARKWVRCLYSLLGRIPLAFFFLLLFAGSLASPPFHHQPAQVILFVAADFSEHDLSPKDFSSL